MPTAATGSGPIHQGSAVTDEIQKAKSDLDRMRDYFKSQPKETIRIPKDRGEQFVQINGYSYSMAAGIPLSVPRDIAQILRDAEVI